LEQSAQKIDLYSPRSGALQVFKESSKLFLDFPTDTVLPIESLIGIEKSIGKKPIEIYRGKTDYIVILETEADVRDIVPNISEIAKLNARGLTVTAKGNEVDFVSRFFAPQSGVDEDPVTGSAHTSLTPIWSKKLHKKELTARQLSKRGGRLTCRNQLERTHIGGHATLYLEGIIRI
jgi:PhzF family phenazine biosynthesis protein